MDRQEIERVMELAAEVFADQGFSGAGMRELCRRCGVGAPTLYHYFGSKERLFEAVCDQKYRNALAGVSKAIGPDRTLEQQLDGLCTEVFELLINDRTLFLLLRRDLIDGSISGRTFRSRHQYSGILGLLLNLIAERYSPEVSSRIAFTAAALIFGYCEFVHVARNLNGGLDDENIEERRLDLVAAVRRLVLGVEPAEQAFGSQTLAV